MPKFQFFLSLVLSLLTNLLPAQNHEKRLSEIDILHYQFQLDLSDTSDVIYGRAEIDIQFVKGIQEFQLDLFSKSKKAKKGMTVKSIQHGKQQVLFNHEDETLRLKLNEPAKKGEIKKISIHYQGIPADGLIIAKNKYGERTFFGDNWPNRAHHWLPTVDHPSDKATVEFIVTAPDHYQIIANGEQIEETNLTDDLKLTHWQEKVPLPTKVMVIGAARFAVHLAGYVEHIPVTSWVYRQDRNNGFTDYKIALEVLDFFVKKIGDYPYEKLANVQSKTRYGGMENAGNIFYYENSVNGKQDQEKLIAHEIAHQWFGNSASELNWHHIWLSEGFATYLTDLYLEEVRGREAFVNNLIAERKTVLKYAHQNPAPVVDPSVSDYNQLLNANSYQKGAWILHMLRRKVGDVNFWKGLNAYYQKYKFANALTEDFQKVMESVSGQDLSTFFQQWIYQAGHPVLEVGWKSMSKDKLRIFIKQHQDVRKSGVFYFPLDLEIKFKSGKKMKKTFEVGAMVQVINFDTEEEIETIVIDPDCWLLFEEH